MEQDRIRVKEHVGIVTNETSTTRLSFLITPLRNGITVEKTDYIILDHPIKGETNPVLAEVTEVKGYEEVVGATVTDKNAGNLVATASIIGYVNLQEQNRSVHKLGTPPNPGSRVYLPYSNFLEDIFSRDINGRYYRNPIHIGTLQAKAVTLNKKEPVGYSLNGETLTSTHTLITGAPGTGKTRIVISLVREISKKTLHSIVVLDPYNEYKKTQFPTGKTQTLRLSRTEVLKDRFIRNMKAFQALILKTENLLPEEKTRVLSKCLEVLWKARLERKIPPFLLVIENVETLKTETLKKMVWEGKKQGLSLLLATKHPVALGGEILSQTTTQIMGKTIDKDDLDYLSNVALEKTGLLPKLKRGDWIINSLNDGQIMQIRSK